MLPELDLRWYPSKVDRRIALVLAVAPALSLAAGMAVFVASEGKVKAFGGTTFMALVYIVLVLPMRYGISSDALVVQQGLVRRHIPLRAIVEVYPTSDSNSAPALSFDRLAIRFGEGAGRVLMISPDDKGAFLAELAARAGLHREGEHLRRSRKI